MVFFPGFPDAARSLKKAFPDWEGFFYCLRPNIFTLSKTKNLSKWQKLDN